MNNQFHSIIHDQRFYKIRYPISSNQQKKYPSYKLKNEQIFKKRHLIDNNQKNAFQFPAKDDDRISQVSRSQSFINQHQARLSLSRLEKQKITLKKINQHFQKDEARYNQDQVKNGIEDKCDKSLQFLMGAKTNAYKTQYSKLTRRKQTIIKRPLMVQQNQRIQSINTTQNQSKNRPFQQFSQSQLIQKYRQLMQQNGPFNFVNKLYQNDLLSTKLMPLLSKQKLLVTKLNNNDKQIEQRINKIVSKPTQYDTIRKMLLNIHDQPDESPYPYQTKELKNQSQLLQYRYHRHFDPVMTIKKQQQLKNQEQAKKLQMKNQVLKNQRQKKQQTFSVPRKIESQSNMNTNSFKQIFPPPKKLVSSAYIIYQVNPQKQKPLKKISIQFSKKRQYQNNVHIGYNIKVASEIASLTKIMTCIIIIQICQKFNINARLQKHKIGSFQFFVHGTTADLQPGEIYTIHELLHGLMLPSGNDASLALARWGGNILLLNDFQSTKRGFFKNEIINKCQVFPWAQNNKFIRNQEQKIRAKRCYNRFIAEMNKKARLLTMQRTTYVNSHGLSNILNRSCCLDLALLCQHAVKDKYFKQIVSCKQFTSIIDKEIVIVEELRFIKKRSKCKNYNYDPEELNLQADAEDQQTEDKSENGDEQQIEIRKVQYTKKQIQWVNTHKLLHERQEYIGIKTGVTTTAGPCLASYVQLNERKFIIIVLNSKKLSQRFVDTEILKHWLVKKEKLKTQNKLFKQLPQTNIQKLQSDNK